MGDFTGNKIGQKAGKTYKVMFSMPYTAWPLARQSPGEYCVWGDCQFYINTPLSECDAWVVFEDLPGVQTVKCPSNKVVLIAAEHHGYKTYSPGFTSQFTRVLACNDSINHPNKTACQLGFPWHAGVGRKNNTVNLTYDDFVSMPEPVKTKTAATVCSDKAITPGHKARLALVNACRNEFPGLIDLYGKRFAALDDKWDALQPYTYQLVIENGAVDHWWTEKLADSYLAMSYPIYWGCPNLHLYFPQESFVRLEMDDISSCIKKIRSIIQKPLTEAQVSALREARRRVLDEYNIFSMLNRLVTADDPGERSQFTIKPMSSFSPGGRMPAGHWLKRLLRRAFQGINAA